MPFVQIKARSYCVAFIALLTSAPALGGPVEDMEPGTWYEVPDSHLAEKQPNPLPPNWSSFAGLFAWAGGCFDTKRDRLLVWGGGHADYAGNEIYAFDLNTLTWSRAWGPSENEYIEPHAPATHSTETYDDGAPSSRHTYDDLVYDMARDRFFSSAGALSWTGSWSAGTWEFDLSNNVWLRRSNAAESTYSQTAYHPTTGIIWRVSESATYSFDPVNDTWQGVESIGSIELAKGSPGGAESSWQMVGEIDPTRDLMVLLGGQQFHVFDLKTQTFSHPQPTGSTTVVNAYAPGLVWDWSSQKLVAWGGGAAVSTITISPDRSSYAIDDVPPSPGNQVVPTLPNKQGTYSKFQYSKNKNVFVLVNGVDENVFIYKLNDKPGVSDNTPPAAPTTLRILK